MKDQKISDFFVFPNSQSVVLGDVCRIKTHARKEINQPGNGGVNQVNAGGL
jgi:hypothetical protein